MPIASAKKRRHVSLIQFASLLYDLHHIVERTGEYDEEDDE